MRCVHNYPPLKYLPQPSRAVADSHLPRQSPQATVRCARGLVISRIDSKQHHGQVTPAQYQRGCRGSRAAVRSPSTDQMSASAPWKRKPLGTSVRPSQGLGLFEDSSSFPIFVLTAAYGTTPCTAQPKGQISSRSIEYHRDILLGNIICELLHIHHLIT